MTEVRRIKMKFGDAEFEADVPEDRVQPMYTQFLCTLQRANRIPPRLINGGGTGFAKKAFAVEPIISPPECFDHDRRINGGDNASAKATRTVETIISSPESSDREVLMRIFDLHEDGAVTLKVLPKGPDTNADAMLLLLYGYYRLKNEECVLATQLFRAAEQSGISLRRPANEYARNSRFVTKDGQRKGSHYALNSHGLAMAKEITAKMIG